MILYHRTQIHLNHYINICEYDPNFNDKVWKRILWGLITTDISMEQPKDPYSVTHHILDLPPPDSSTFVPFDKVTQIVVLDWIYKLVPNMPDIQRKNTEFLLQKMSGNQHPLDMSH